MSTILVVDDAQTDRELMARVINASGHHALIAVDGKQAVALAKQYKPSLIFLDVVMPVMDGFAACRQLMRDPDTSAGVEGVTMNDTSGAPVVGTA